LNAVLRIKPKRLYSASEYGYAQLLLVVSMAVER